MVHESPFVVRTVHSHGVQGKHLLVKGCHGPIVLQIQKKFNFNAGCVLRCLLLRQGSFQMDL